MTGEQCKFDPRCEMGLHEDGAFPCPSLKPEPPGSPCRYCGVPTPLNGDSCPTCWQPVTPENAHEVAAELSFAVEVARLNREEGYKP